MLPALAALVSTTFCRHVLLIRHTPLPRQRLTGPTAEYRAFWAAMPVLLAARARPAGVERSPQQPVALAVRQPGPEPPAQQLRQAPQMRARAQAQISRTATNGWSAWTRRS